MPERTFAATRGKAFAARLRELRKKAGLSEAELCRALHPDERFRWEAQKTLRGDWTGGISFREMHRIAVALGCSLDDLVVLEEAPDA